MIDGQNMESTRTLEKIVKKPTRGEKAGYFSFQKIGIVKKRGKAENDY